MPKPWHLSLGNFLVHLFKHLFALPRSLLKEGFALGLRVGSAPVPLGRGLEGPVATCGVVPN